jgi:DNA-binding XRE family transcriptional regulator
MKIKQNIQFEEYLNKQLESPKFRKHYSEFGKQLEIAYQILQLRKKVGMSQVELARRIGTTQGNIARIESGKQNFTTEILVRIARALGKEVRVEFV